MGEFPSDGIYRVAGPTAAGVPVAVGGSPLVVFEAPNNGTWINPVSRALGGLNAAANAIWTPALGARVIVSGMLISVSQNASRGSAAPVSFTITDGSNNLLVWQVFIPGAAGTAIGSPTTGWCQMPMGGYRCAVNAVVSLNIPGGLATGTASCSLTGWEV